MFRCGISWVPLNNCRNTKYFQFKLQLGRTEDDDGDYGTRGTDAQRMDDDDGMDDGSDGWTDDDDGDHGTGTTGRTRRNGRTDDI